MTRHTTAHKTSPHPRWATDGAGWPNGDASTWRRAGRVDWHVQVMGAGPDLLLLHGSGGATHSWRDLLPLLAASWRVTAPDLPGHGFSRAASSRQLSLPGMADAVSALAEDMALAPDLIVGHSAGAAIGIQTVLDGALAPRSVIGLNAALTPFRGLAGLVFPPMAKLLAMNPATPWLFSQLAGSRGQAARLIEGTGSRIDPEGLAHYGALLARPDHVGSALTMMASWTLDPLLAALPDIKIPVHLVVGLDDQAVPPREAIGLAARNPMITVHEIAAMGHLMHEEDAGRMAALIRRIAGTEPATP
ncbi:MAG: alpha/beta fold hydrolase BchO [Pseudomonadota bacterium]